MTEEAASHPCILITGASSGLGWEYAQQLAPVTQHLVLVARRKDKLQELQAALESQHTHLKVTAYSIDLASEDERFALMNTLMAQQIQPTMLINNAGLGDYGEFASADWEKIRAMIDVNMTALTHLSYFCVRDMIKHGQGAILNVSSLASILPLSDFAVYAATKAYVSSFSEALRAELREYKIPVLTVCPGPVKTGFGDVASRSDEQRFSNSLYGKLNVPAEQVVRESLQALSNDRPRLYPGIKVAALAAGITLLPLAAIRVFNSLRFRKSSPSDS